MTNITLLDVIRWANIHGLSLSFAYDYLEEKCSAKLWDPILCRTVVSVKQGTAKEVLQELLYDVMRLKD